MAGACVSSALAVGTPWRPLRRATFGCGAGGNSAGWACQTRGTTSCPHSSLSRSTPRWQTSRRAARTRYCSRTTACASPSGGAATAGSGARCRRAPRTMKCRGRWSCRLRRESTGGGCWPSLPGGGTLSCWQPSTSRTQGHPPRRRRRVACSAGGVAAPLPASTSERARETAPRTLLALSTRSGEYPGEHLYRAVREITSRG
mmetsp:Transcript_8346/g.29293  ORF Transcript_8346/g.29293 Transcript_8346/m.29293 type:complete len:202 (-) Transcript_8346:259-864(-)